jgi:glycerophosphoryl diester phosphodiesterase
LLPRAGKRLDAWLRPRGARPLVLGHRGARNRAPENTLRAFELALAEGADGIELDVRLDGDRRVIVLHDRTLERVSEGSETRDVEQLGAHELDRVSLRGERVPLLADVLSWAHGRQTRVNVELKSDVSHPLALVREVCRVVRASGAGPESLIFSSFHAGLVAALGVRLPGLPRAWLIDAGNWALRRAPGFRLFANGVNPHRALVTPDAMAAWKTADTVISTWTVNDPEEARRLSELGVDAIISDEPGKILDRLS